jgi:hypothetical protein
MIPSSGIGGDDDDRDDYYVGPTRQGHSGSWRVTDRGDGKNGRGRCLRLHQQCADVDDQCNSQLHRAPRRPIPGGGGDGDGDGAAAMISPSSSSSSAPPPTSTLSITATTMTTTTTSMRPGELSMLLWAYAIVDPCDRPLGWEGPRRTEQPLMQTSTILPSSHLSSYTSSYEHASDNDDFVTILKFPGDDDDNDNNVNSFPSSYSSSGRVGSDDVANSVNTTTTTTIAAGVHCPENTTTALVGCSNPPR